MNTVHAHEFLNLVGEQSEPQSLDTLKALAEAKFGADVRFHTCRLEGMDIDALITFVTKMEKIVDTGNGYQLNRANVCSH